MSKENPPQVEKANSGTIEFHKPLFSPCQLLETTDWLMASSAHALLSSNPTRKIKEPLSDHVHQDKISQYTVSFRKQLRITSGSDSWESKSWWSRLLVAEAKLAMNCGLIEVPMDEAPII